MEHELSLLFTILGFMVGVIAIILTVLIYGKVDSIRIKQVENAQGPYKIQTSKNMNEIHGCFRDIMRLTKNSDPEELDIDESIDFSSITSELESYYQQNANKMNELLEKSNRDLMAWYDLDKNVRPKLQDIIDGLRWLIKDFFQINNDQEMQTRVWTDNHNELLQRKFKIEKTIDDFQKFLT